MSANFQSNLKQAKQFLKEKELTALHAIGAFVHGETVLRAPVDTGNLRGSYSYKVEPEKKSVTIGTAVDYAPYVEKGTSKQQAQPHLTPAVEENLSIIPGVFATAVKDK